MKTVHLLGCILAYAHSSLGSSILGQPSTSNETAQSSAGESTRRELKAGSSLDFLSQAMLLSPGKLPQARVRVNSGSKKAKKAAHNTATAEKANAERQEAVALAEGIGGELMQRLAEGLKATGATLAEIESRVAGSAGTSFGPGSAGGAGSDSSEGHVDVARVFAQGVTFQSDEARARLVDKFTLELLAEQPAERNFVIGVMGTSVTAGHDNWFNESWAQVLGQWLNPTFGAAGVGVDVRNHAIGGNRYETSAYCARATVGDDVDAFFFEFNMIFHGPADAYEAFIRNVMLGIPTNPTFCQMLGFDALNPEVPKRADETGALVTGKADGIDLEKGLVLGKYRGRANTGKYLDWKEWIPAEALTNLPQKEKGTYKGLIKTPNYWREGRNNLFEYYDQLGMHWSDPDGYNFELGHLPQYWGVSVNGGKAAPCGAAAWHPGPAAHALRALVKKSGFEFIVLAHAYISAMDDALRVAIAHVSSQQGGMFKTGPEAALSSARALRSQALQRAQAQKAPPPLTKALQQPHSKSGHSSATFLHPKCATTMAPVSPGASLLLLVDKDRTSDGRRVVDTRHSYSSSGQGGGEGGRGAQGHNAKGGVWQVVAPPWAQIEVNCDAKAGYLDRKWAMRGDVSSGWLSLKFKVEQPGTPLALCEVACLWGKCPKGRGSLLTDVDYELSSSSGHGAPMAARMTSEKGDSEASKGTPLLRLLMKSKVCVEVVSAGIGGGSGSSNAYGGLALAAGTHELRLRVNKPETYVLLSHLIWY